MDIEKKAFEFASMAHMNQKRKMGGEPYIIHPKEVGNILKEYGFDSNVVAAGYLHDVVEDTKYTLEDIENNFGSDIASLVSGDSEPDKSLSWEKRKENTISSIRNLDIRHKAIVCADKINNIEQLILAKKKYGKVDYSSFKRGQEKQQWYYENIYKSLIENEDLSNPIFTRLKEDIDYLFS